MGERTGHLDALIQATDTWRSAIDQSDLASDTPRACRVFVSYAHAADDPGHAEQVRRLWEFLRSCGIDARLDRLAAGHRQDWSLWMANEIRAADVILVIASRAYRERAEDSGDPTVGRGVQWEARLIRNAFYRDQRVVDRFVPVVLPGQSVEGVPDFLAPYTSTVYYVSDFTVDGAGTLLRLLTGQPDTLEPPLGQLPALPPQPTTPQRPTVDRVADRAEQTASVRNQVTGSVTGPVIQAGTIGSVTFGGSGEARTPRAASPPPTPHGPRPRC
jgi:hypothetical protein